MVKRLVITGVPCPREAWEEFLGPSPDQVVIPIREVFENVDSADPREMSQYIVGRLFELRPQSIVCHDIGVPLTLMALGRLRRQGLQWPTRLTIFNGAFRGVSLWHASHPLKIQWMSRAKAVREAERIGGRVDFGLLDYFDHLRSMYRFVMLYRLSESMTSFLGLGDLIGFPGRSRFPMPIQIIASKNDPVLPFEAVSQLARDLYFPKWIEAEYGHFPYSVPRQQILPFLESFEREGGVEVGPAAPKRRRTPSPRRPSPSPDLSA